ncbi:dynamin family protein [Nonomuraea zeae]|uniref:Dynamin N-terminal domain-containing protein n=1 Tax=Nonomuraea zeae TaxID=1642303 RepID=A0A5S4GAH8_9ACTN|nr:dynamin family protein [Nonomuraea zeae]TMR29514.1 hypothetical protein ETD85_32200 [Nonomuraea zeae]
MSWSRTLDRALALLGGSSPELAPARQVLRELAADGSARLRVALVGRVSAGKSTLVNALLGGERVMTGVTEVTYNVNWLRHGPVRTLVVHYRDGRPPERRDIAELPGLTRDQLGAIDHLVVTDPNPCLRSFDIVDTPGLDSHLGGDSRNTLRFLGRPEDDLGDRSVLHAGRADAMVLVMTRALSAGEEGLLAGLRGEALTALSPVTAVGALTKVEGYWPRHDPMAEGRRIADRLMTAAGGARLLFDLRPLCSLVAAGAGTLTEAGLADLALLATVDPALLERRIALGPYFATREYADLPVPAARRRELMSGLSGYGVALACSLIREGCADLPGLRAELLSRSGVADFRRLLTGHFGNRAEVIRQQRLIGQARGLRAELAARLRPRELSVLDAALAPVLDLELTEHAFRELAVLREHYEGRLELTGPQLEEVLRVTGEHGRAVPERLGLTAGAGRDQILARARERVAYWAGAEAAGSHAGTTRVACQVIRRSYERILTQSEAAVAGSG